MNTMKRIFSEESLTCVPKSRAYKKALAALSEASQDISALFAESTGSDASRLFERYQDASAEVQELIWDACPWVWLWQTDTIDGTASYVEGYVPHPSGYFQDFTGVTFAQE